MPNINIGNEIKLTINNDPERVIHFDPSRVEFAEGFYGLLQKLDQMEKDYLAKMTELEKEKDVDVYGVPVNEGKKLTLLRALCDELKAETDKIFGPGTSETVFRGASSLAMFEDFFNGLAPYVQKARADKIQKHTGNRAQRRAALK